MYKEHKNENKFGGKTYEIIFNKYYRLLIKKTYEGEAVVELLKQNLFFSDYKIFRYHLEIKDNVEIFYHALNRAHKYFKENPKIGVHVSGKEFLLFHKQTIDYFGFSRNSEPVGNRNQLDLLFVDLLNMWVYYTSSTIAFLELLDSTGMNKFLSREQFNKKYQPIKYIYSERSIFDKCLIGSKDELIISFETKDYIKICNYIIKQFDKKLQIGERSLYLNDFVVEEEIINHTYVPDSITRIKDQINQIDTSRLMIHLVLIN